MSTHHHVRDPLGCEQFALRSYLYALAGLVLFVSSALGVGAEFADGVATGSSILIAVVICLWIGALLVAAYAHSKSWIVKHISAGIFAIVSGLVAGVVARRLGLVPAVRRSAMISVVFSTVAAVILLVSGASCISGVQLIACAIASIAIVEVAAAHGILELNLLNEVRLDVSVQRIVSTGFLMSLFVYLLELSKRVCRKSVACNPGDADYIETVMAPYTKTVRLLFYIVSRGSDDC